MKRSAFGGRSQDIGNTYRSGTVVGEEMTFSANAERKDDNEDDHDRKTNADTPYADPTIRFPRRWELARKNC